jgi:hypothetical protein
MKYLKKYNESIDEKVSFYDLCNFSKEIDGFKGDEFGFEVPYEYGTMTINKVSDYKSDVTWWSGGDSQDTDVYDNTVILNMLRKI